MTLHLSTHVHLGRPLSAHGLALVPLFPATPPVPFEDLAAALHDGTALVEEEAQPRVPSLQVQNSGLLPVLVTEGALLVGGMQDRICGRPTWVEAGQRASVPVHCVEAGRWQRRGASPFRTERADPVLRHARMRRRADQGETWRLVAERRHRAGLADGGGSVVEARDEVSVGRLATDLALPWGATGVIASWGHPGCSRWPLIEWSASPAAFRAAWPGLLRAVLHAHLDHLAAGGVPRAPWVRLSDVAALVAKVDAPAEVDEVEAGPGARALRFRRGCMEGWAVRAADRLVHVSAVRR